ncbi:hypothetical protein DFQ30_009023 [Apophysomyces sp. BC1015]|nr:hypothetical protein DFQ30_009023 [Apophysomyces sp. BC1015]
MPHILIVDDDPNSRNALAEIVAGDGLTIAMAGDVREARIQIVRQVPDVVFTDLQLPDGSGVELFDDLDLRSGVEIVVITGHATVESAVSALKMGATDYLVKPINVQRVKAILGRIPRTGDLRAEIGSLRGELRRFGRFGLMLGNSPAMQQVYDQINRVAPTSASVLLVGESGTGKEVAAQTVHELSLRRKQAFLAVNCGAVSATLIESEMFGHERGAFTGADRQHKGYFERASGGTLFLDEITEMPIELQAKLLRAVVEGKLRLDLYHRLNVFPISLPPLRERGKDVGLLAQSFLDELNQRYGTDKHFPPSVKETLLSYLWPGNVRELKNYVQRAYIMAQADSSTTASVPLQISLSKPSAGTAVTIAFGTSLAEADRQLILATLEQCGGVKTRAAEILGISLKTLYNRLVGYGDDARSGSGGDAGDGDGSPEKVAAKHSGN